jgi:hypothetical protein
VLRAKEHAPTLSFVVFILGFAFESFKEFGGASKDVVGDWGVFGSHMD